MPGPWLGQLQLRQRARAADARDGSQADVCDEGISIVMKRVSVLVPANRRSHMTATKDDL